MALSNRQTFFFDGQTYNYRITEAAIRRFERDGKRRIHSGMSLTMVVRAYIMWLKTLCRPALARMNLLMVSVRDCYAHAKTVANTPCVAFAL